MNCCTKGCDNTATHRYISPAGTEYPVCFSDLTKHQQQEVIEELRKRRLVHR